MSNPRLPGANGTDYPLEGVHEGFRSVGVDTSITFSQDQYVGNTYSSPQTGLAVVLVGNNQVGLGAAGGRPEGKLMVDELDGQASIQDKGITQIPYAQTPTAGYATPTLGASVVVDGAGNVQGPGGTAVPFNGTEVISINTTTHTCYVRFN